MRSPHQKTARKATGSEARADGVSGKTAKGKLAERGGFEPPIELPLCRISSAVHSTTLPPLREVIRHIKTYPVDGAAYAIA